MSTSQFSVFRSLKRGVGAACLGAARLGAVVEGKPRVAKGIDASLLQDAIK